MTQRLAMNSRALQERFPEVYRDFFARCEIVVSAPGAFYWFGDHADRYGEIGVKQKVPLRAYVGLEPTNGQAWTFGDSRYFVPSEQSFRSMSRQTPRLRRVSAMLQDWARQHGIAQAYRVRIITEIPVSCGLSSWAAVSASLAAAVFLKAKRFRADEVSRWSATPLSQLTGHHSFDQLFRLSWKIEALFNADASSGCGVFAALVDSSFPIIYTTEKRRGDRLHHPGSRVPSDVGDDYSLLDTIHFWGYRLNEFFGLQTTENWPIDFGLVYSGSTGNAEFAIRASKDLQLTLDGVDRAVTEAIRKNVSPRQNIQPAFMDRRQQGSGLWDNYLAAMGTASLEGLLAFKRLFDRGDTEQAVGDLFRAINLFQSYLKVFNVSTPTLRLLKHYLNKAAIAEETSIAVKITGTGRGGDFLFVTPLFAFEHSIDSLLKTLRQKVDPRVWLDYASWIDGIEERGLVIEQDLNNNLSSSFVSAGGAVVTTWQDRGRMTQAVSPEQLDSLRQRSDLFLDPRERTILIRGQAISSKELHSRKVTVAVLRLLLENLGKAVPASRLPVSSYTDRTTMQGKIVGPLCEAFQRRTNKKLSLTISGGLNKNFSLTLDIDGLTIGQVEKRL